MDLYRSCLLGLCFSSASVFSGLVIVVCAVICFLGCFGLFLGHVGYEIVFYFSQSTCQAKTVKRNIVKCYI